MCKCQERIDIVACSVSGAIPQERRESGECMILVFPRFHEQNLVNWLFKETFDSFNNVIESKWAKGTQNINFVNKGIDVHAV